MKAVAPNSDKLTEERAEKPYSKRGAALNLIVFSLLFTAWFVIQLHK